MASSDRDPDIVTADDAASRPGMPAAEALAALAEAGELPGQKLGRQSLFSWTRLSADWQDRDPEDYLTAGETARRLRLRKVQTLLALAGAGKIPGARKFGRTWLFSWPELYTWIAGPDVPPGEVLDVRTLASRFGVPEQAVRRAAIAGGLPGRQVGKQWRFALEAARLALGRGIPGGASAPDTGSPALPAGAPPAG